MTPTTLAYFALGAITGAVLVIAAAVLIIGEDKHEPSDEADSWQI